MALARLGLKFKIIGQDSRL